MLEKNWKENNNNKSITHLEFFFLSFLGNSLVKEESKTKTTEYLGNKKNENATYQNLCYKNINSSLFHLYVVKNEDKLTRRRK